MKMRILLFFIIALIIEGCHLKPLYSKNLSNSVIHVVIDLNNNQERILKKALLEKFQQKHEETKVPDYVLIINLDATKNLGLVDVSGISTVQKIDMHAEYCLFSINKEKYIDNDIISDYKTFGEDEKTPYFSKKDRDSFKYENKLDKSMSQQKDERYENIISKLTKKHKKIICDKNYRDNFFTINPVNIAAAYENEIFTKNATTQSLANSIFYNIIPKI